MTGLVGVCLAAGAGSRLMPLTMERPKVLCPVAGRPLLAHALDRLVGVTAEVVVNVHHHHAMMMSWLKAVAEVGNDGFEPEPEFWRAFERDRHVRPTQLKLHDLGAVGDTRSTTNAEIRLMASVEGPEALGTAGALAVLPDHLDGRAVLAVNADSYFEADLAEVVRHWDGERPLVAHGGSDGFRPGVPVLASITPWETIVGLPTTPSGLYGHLWREADRSGGLQTVQVGGPMFDCGTPRSYLAANLALSGGRNSREGAEVDSGDDPDRVARSVLWSGASVAAGERLDGAIRTTAGRTLLVRPVPE